MDTKIRSIEDFLALLEGVKQAREGQYLALCPGHHDTKPSLSIKVADGKILLKCFGGCELADILKPLKLESKDLFLDAPKAKPQDREIVATYHYLDANGRPFQVVRVKPKSFFQRRPDGRGGFINDLKGIKPTLYHQDQLKPAIAAGTVVYVVEGEKDADRLGSLGLVATTNPGGASKWRDSYSEALAGADIVPIPDNDRAGRDHVAQLCRSCHGKVKRCRVLLLPAEVKDISDWLDKGGNIEQLSRLLADSSDYELPVDATLPEVMVTDRQLRDISADALEALYKANKPERLFRRSGALTRVNLDEKERPYTEALGESAFRGILTRSCNFSRNGLKGGEVAVSPPLDTVRDCLSLGQWDFPALLGITESPVMRPDGTVITNKGYDEATNLYYYPAPELKIPPIPDQPSADDVRAAIELALEPLRQFPFDSEASRANAIGTMLLPILRPLIKGPTPFALFDKPSAGTGASLLAWVISLVATGRAAAMMAAPKSDEEWNKSITSLLIRGQTVIVIDNIEFDLQSPSLAAVLTADIYQSRVLGRSESILLPNRSTWVGTGNNIRLRGDLPRRCVWCRMDAKLARPWLRGKADFDHPDLPRWVIDNRGDILGAILTIARAWVVAGKPEAPELPNLGGYEGYCEVIGGVLAYMGIAGFLGNLAAMYDTTDTETPEWEAFLEAWLEYAGDNPITAGELSSIIEDNSEFRACLPEKLAGRDGREYSRRLGGALAKRNGVRYPKGLMISKAGTLKRAIRWQVSYGVSYENDGTLPDSRLKGELGELSPFPRGEKNKKNTNLLYRGGGGADSPNSPLGTDLGELAPPDTLIYPTHNCLKCGRDSWALSPDGQQYVCSECDYVHPDPCEHCHPEPKEVTDG